MSTWIKHSDLEHNPFRPPKRQHAWKSERPSRWDWTSKAQKTIHILNHILTTPWNHLQLPLDKAIGTDTIMKDPGEKPHMLRSLPPGLADLFHHEAAGSSSQHHPLRHAHQGPAEGSNWSNDLSGWGRKGGLFTVCFPLCMHVIFNEVLPCLITVVSMGLTATFFLDLWHADGERTMADLCRSVSVWRASHDRQPAHVVSCVHYIGFPIFRQRFAQTKLCKSLKRYKGYTAHYKIRSPHLHRTPRNHLETTMTWVTAIVACAKVEYKDYHLPLEKKTQPKKRHFPKRNKADQCISSNGPPRCRALPNRKTPWPPKTCIARCARSASRRALRERIKRLWGKRKWVV